MAKATRKAIMKNIALAVSTALCVATLAWVAVAQTAPQAEGTKTVAAPSLEMTRLLDRGSAAKSAVPTKGGTTPPTGPTPIFFPGPPPGSPGAVPAPPGFGALGISVFGMGPAAGGYLGNLFLPGSGYPPSFLTSGAVSGFDVTGAYAWHLAPSPAASFFRIVGAASVPPPPTPLAPAGPIATGISAGTAVPGPGTPAPSALISLIGAWPPVRVTPGISGIYCGLLVGGPGYMPTSVAPPAGPAGNGLGGIMGGVQPPLRAAPFPLGVATALPTILAPPAAYIVGCYADSSTTPVELMAFGIE